MMGRIEERFALLKKRGRKALVAYITAGDPDLETTKRIILTLETAGVDILEIGVPFSDPTADGPVIQAASQRALKSGATLADILKTVAAIRQKSSVPIVLFGYYNPILSFGPKRFAAAASSAGVDGILVVDLPREEADELRLYTDPAEIDFITLVAPTTDSARIRKIMRRASGFVYYISITGVTGATVPMIEDVKAELEKLKENSHLPIVVGFGISTPKQAADFAPFADGIVVGSAFVRLIGEIGKGVKPLTDIAELAAEMRRAIDAR
jgi:tryptophan synthase alpha chain